MDKRAALHDLVGLPLSAATSANGMEMFAFGDLKTVPFDGAPEGVRQIGTFALHVQTSWRLVNGDKILVEDADYYFPSVGGHHKEPETSRFHERMADFFRLYSRDERFVDEASHLAGNGFALKLSGGCVLEVVPDTSDDSELWRLFKPGTTEEHVVCKGAS